MKIISFGALLLILTSISAVAQDFMYINDNNKIQSSPPPKSFQYVKEVRLTPGFSVVGSSGQWYARPVDPVNAPQSLDKSFVRTETMLVKVIDEQSISTLPVTSKSMTYSYVDGIGRPLQDVNVKGSPSTQDIVQFYEYDGFGRQANSYLPYAINNRSGSFRPNAWGQQGEQSSFYKTPPTGVAQESFRPFSFSDFEESPLNRVKKSYGPGNDWFSASKGTETKVLINNADEVLQWTYNGPNPPTLGTANPPTLVGFYAANLLTFSETIDEEGQIKRVYQNFFGQTVLERVGKNGIYHDTYFIYDWEGNVFCVIPPEGTIKAAFFDTSLGIWKYPYRDEMNVTQRQTFLNDWAFQYDYDTYQRVIGKKIPGSDWVFMVYDNWDRLVLSQDGKLRSTNQWTFTKYDEFNRAIVTGFYSSSGTQASVQGDVNSHYSTSPQLKRFETRLSSSSIGYTLDKSFPVNPSESNLLTISYYDDHAFKTYPDWDVEGKDYTYLPENGLPALSDLPATLKGYATGSKVKILESSQWMNNVSYYDKNYNVIQVISENHLNGTDRISSDIDFAGRAKKILRTHSTDLGSFALLEENTYDHAGRLTKKEHTLDGQKVILSALNYNELGELIEKNLHALPASPTSFLQSVDYRYNIRGWLTHINNSTFTSDANNNDTNDLFGMELSYNQSIPSINGTTPAPLYNGNISAIKWKSSNLIDAPKEKVFGFGYDTWSRLAAANYAAKNGSDFTGDVGMYNNSYSYDKNGNLKTLSRQGKTQSGQAQIDNLSYGYVSGNRLKWVEDGTAYDDFGVKGSGFTEISDYWDALPQNIPAEYLYDANGNAIGDMNKGVDVTYNHLNMPVTVSFGGGKQIIYTYDALGNKIKQQVLNGSTEIAKRDYIGGAHYEKGVLAYVQNKEGRAIKDGSNWFYEYHLRDHQNNTMVAFGSLEESTVYKASMEVDPASRATYEETTFKNIANRRDGMFNHTQKTVEYPIAEKSAWLNGASGREIGPATVIQVNSGDRLKMEVYARYVMPQSGANADIVGSLVNLVAQGTFGHSPGELAYTGFNNHLPGATSAVTASGSNPKAYLNYIIFNSDYTTYQYGWDGVGIDAAVDFEKLELEITVPSGYTNGYAYIFITNESNYNTYFDDLYILHEKTNPVLQVTQRTDYYPFGVSFDTYNKESVSPNRYLYQAQENQDDFNYEEYQYKYRMHDPSMGRFLSVDPLAEDYRYNSVYAFSENRVIDGIELEGAEWQPIGLSWGSTITNSGANGYQFVTNDIPNYAGRVGDALYDVPTFVAHTVMYHGFDYNPELLYSNGMHKYATYGTYEAIRNSAITVGEGVKTSAAAETGGLLFRAGAPFLFKSPGVNTFTPSLNKVLTSEASATATQSNLWKVGSYSELRGLQAGLDAHHVGQKALMSRFVSDYSWKEAPSILVPRIGHTTSSSLGIVSRNMAGFTNARQVLARDIFELRRVYSDVPGSSLMDLIQLNKQMYPTAFMKIP